MFRIPTCSAETFLSLSRLPVPLPASRPDGGSGGRHRPSRRPRTGARRSSRPVHPRTRGSAAAASYPGSGPGLPGGAPPVHPQQPAGQRGHVLARLQPHLRPRETLPLYARHRSPAGQAIKCGCRTSTPAALRHPLSTDKSISPSPRIQQSINAIPFQVSALCLPPMRRYIVIAGLVTLTLFCAGFARSTATRSAGQTRLAKATAPATSRRATSRRATSRRATSRRATSRRATSRRATSRRATSGEPYNQADGLGIPDLTKLASDLTS